MSGSMQTSESRNAPKTTRMSSTSFWNSVSRGLPPSGTNSMENQATLFPRDCRCLVLGPRQSKFCGARFRQHAVLGLADALLLLAQRLDSAASDDVSRILFQLRFVA